MPKILVVEDDEPILNLIKTNLTKAGYRCKCARDGREIPLTLKEYEVFALPIQNRNIALSRETIYEKLWGEEYAAESRTVDLHMN